MLKSEALSYFGGVKAKLTRAAGVRAPTYYRWGDIIPEAAARRLEEATGGELYFDKDLYKKIREAKREKYRKAKRAGKVIHENQA
ncbi:Cro/CI family transcriptional regulator [Escherichia coli]|uniref:Cro/CI family transcriptional regulator n=1 Tax=Escherichia coli TaxID=562 RepID=UPI000BE190AB|nr:Cro/CI family transcriptional regulator [Escherichia coli]